MTNLYLDKLKAEIPKEIRQIGRDNLFSNSVKVDKEIVAKDFFDFWLSEMKMTKEDFLNTCSAGNENELCNFIFDTYAEDNGYRLHLCDEFLDVISQDKKLLIQSLKLCLKKHTAYVSLLDTTSPDRGLVRQELLEKSVSINETIFKKLLEKVKYLNIHIPADELLTSNTGYTILMEEVGLSSKRSLELDKLKDLVSKELLKNGSSSTKEQSILKDYLISVGDTFANEFTDAKSVSKWLAANFDKDSLKRKGFVPFKIAAYILEDSSTLTEKNRETLIKSWMSDLENTKEISDNYSNIEVIATNNPKLLADLTSKIIESRRVEIEFDLNSDKGRYNRPTFTRTNYTNNTLENLYCLGVARCIDSNTLLSNWLAIKPYIDEMYKNTETNLGYKAEMYLGAFEMLLSNQPDGGYSLEEQKLISKQLKKAVTEGTFNHFMSLARENVSGTISRLSGLEKYIDLSDVRSFYNDNLESLLKIYLGQTEVGSQYEKALNEDRIPTALKFFQDSITKLSLYDGMDNVDLYGIKYCKSLSRRGSYERDFPLVLDLLVYGTDNPSIISKVIVGNEDEVLNYKDSKEIGFMEKVLIKSKGRAEVVLNAIADYPETFKKVILDDKKLTKKLYNLKNDNVTRIMDKCKIEIELSEVKKDDVVLKPRSLKI